MLQMLDHCHFRSDSLVGFSVLMNLCISYQLTNCDVRLLQKIRPSLVGFLCVHPVGSTGNVLMKSLHDSACRMQIMVVNQ